MYRYEGRVNALFWKVCHNILPTQLCFLAIANACVLVKKCISHKLVCHWYLYVTELLSLIYL
jgi:hypothetical protein